MASTTSEPRSSVSKPKCAGGTTHLACSVLSQALLQQGTSDYDGQGDNDEDPKCPQRQAGSPRRILHARHGTTGCPGLQVEIPLTV